MKILEMCQEERPREKILRYGVIAASNAELLAVLLGCGTRNANVLEVSQSLLLLCDGCLTELASYSVEKMSEQKGIGRAKAITLAAAFELGRRMGEEKFKLRKQAVLCAKDVYEAYGKQLKGREKEECWVSFLNQAQYVIGKEQIGLGDCSCTVIDICNIVKRALERKARKLILVHNHPSGNPTPSRADIQQTQKLKEALAPFEIKLLDHLIISDDSYYSFCDECIYFANSQRPPLSKRDALNSSK